MNCPNTVEIVAVSKSFGGLPVVHDVSITVQRGKILSLLGPSGCGKTTTLRMVAGFEHPDRGKIVLDGLDVTNLKPYERSIGLVFQDYALFPHMSVTQNISYGLKRHGVGKTETQRRVDEMLSLVKLTGFEDRLPGALSGGQQQRVALARALAIRPSVLLLDEPLSALDTKLRSELRSELRQILTAAGITTIIVTHDQEEAMSLSDQIAVMNNGRIEQAGDPITVYANPKTTFVAEFLGRANWFRGRLAGQRPDGFWRYEVGDMDALVINLPAGMDTGPIDVGIRPERIKVLTEAETGERSGGNKLVGTLTYVENLGSELHYCAMLGNGTSIRVVEKQQGQHVQQAGDQVRLAFPADAVFLVPGSESAN